VPLFLRQGWDTTKASPVLSFAFAGCPILAVPLFLRQGWDTTKASPVLSFGSSAALYPRQNVAKSVAKARKSHQVTTSQPQPHQRHRMDLPLKEPHPPPFRRKRGIWRTLVVLQRCQSSKAANSRIRGRQARLFLGGVLSSRARLCFADRIQNQTQLLCRSIHSGTRATPSPGKLQPPARTSASRHRKAELPLGTGCGKPPRSPQSRLPRLTNAHCEPGNCNRVAINNRIAIEDSVKKSGEDADP